MRDERQFGFPLNATIKWFFCSKIIQIFFMMFFFLVVFLLLLLYFLLFFCCFFYVWIGVIMINLVILDLPSCRWVICGCVEWHHHQQWLLWLDCPILRLHGWPTANDVVWYAWLSSLLMHYQPIPIPKCAITLQQFEVKQGEKEERNR